MCARITIVYTRLCITLTSMKYNDDAGHSYHKCYAVEYASARARVFIYVRELLTEKCTYCFEWGIKKQFL